MKDDIQRGDFGAWAVKARDALDPLTVEEVAEALHYSAPSIRKVEAGGPASKRMRKDLPAYYARLARERGLVVEAPPGAATESQPSDMAALVSALAHQTAAINALVGLSAQAQRELVAEVVGATLEPLWQEVRALREQVAGMRPRG